MRSTRSRTAIALLLCLASLTQPLVGQPLTQTVRGVVLDDVTRQPLPGANVALAGTGLGSVAGHDGAFRIPRVPLGRYDVQVTHIGYHPRLVPEVLVGAAKEVVLQVELSQSPIEMGGVTVVPQKRKDQPQNPAAAVSARAFSVEETRRYAGGLDDPARMASAFAGVAVSSQSQNNAVAIRGNAPRTVQWRLEGLEIPNPNHFAGGNVAGGGFVTIFSSQLLADSDFLTGAFPAEYGNALGGVFDIRLRHGNAERREYAFQAGALGIDFAAEGPVSLGSGASYLVNYRYATFGLIYHLLPDVEQVPRYQDLSFKVQVPTRRWGTFSLFGVGALDALTEPEEPDSSRWSSEWDRIHIDGDIAIGAAGLNHSCILGRDTYLRTTLATSLNRTWMDQDRLDAGLALQPDERIHVLAGRHTLSSYIDHRFGRRHTSRTGFALHRLFYDQRLCEVDDRSGEFTEYVDADGAAALVQAYTQSQVALSDRLQANLGAHLQHFALNGRTSLEPRASVKWALDADQSLALGYGLHSQLDELSLYLSEQTVDGRTVQPNRDLDFSKAHHLTLAYQRRLGPQMRLVVEPYVQRLFDIPVVPGTSFSVVNFVTDYYLDDTFTNDGTGWNRGVDLTLERFLDRGYYGLATGSLHQSRYTAGDGVERDTRYNRGYVLDVLGGREIRFGRGARQRLLGLNGRLTAMGGERRHPPDLAASARAGELVEDETRAFQDRFPAYLNLDFTVTWRTDRPAWSSVWALQIKNLLGRAQPEGYIYDYRKARVVDDEMVIVVPVLSYKIEF